MFLGFAVWTYVCIPCCWFNSGYSSSSIFRRHWYFSERFLGSWQGFVVTGLCLPRRIVLHTHHARMFSSLIEFCISHLKCFFYLHGSACPFLITLLCVSILATLLRVSILATLLRVIACDSIRFFFTHNLPPLNPQGSLDSIISHIGLS